MKSAAWTRKKGKNPSGGLNAAGRASYNEETGGTLRPPVKSGDNPRRASFLARMGNVLGPMIDDKGEPTRLALALKAWGASSKADARQKAKAISARNSISKHLVLKARDRGAALKAWAKRKRGSVDGGLPENASRYFDTGAPGAKMIAVSSLTTTRARPDGIANAEKYMQATGEGGAKRKPITVRENGAGGYDVVDGNSTVAIARKNGWKEIPVTVEAKQGTDLFGRKPKADDLPELTPDKPSMHSPEVAKLAAGLREKALKEEPAITSLMSSIVQEAGGRLVDGEHRVKTTESLGNKIEKDARNEGISHEQAAAKVSDSVRYTMDVSNENYTATLKSTIDRMTADGYEVRAKNFWTGGDPYDGTNIKASKNGITVELQLHTKSSIDIKHKNHSLYKLYEKEKNESTRRSHWDTMVENAKAIVRPAAYATLLTLGSQSIQSYQSAAAAFGVGG